MLALTPDLFIIAFGNTLCFLSSSPPSLPPSTREGGEEEERKGVSSLPVPSGGGGRVWLSSAQSRRSASPSFSPLPSPPSLPSSLELCVCPSSPISNISLGGERLWVGVGEEVWVIDVEERKPIR